MSVSLDGMFGLSRNFWKSSMDSFEFLASEIKDKFHSESMERMISCCRNSWKTSMETFELLPSEIKQNYVPRFGIDIKW